MRPALLLALLASAPASAVPFELAHQGRLLDSAGVPLDGDHTLTLSLYDVPSGGEPFWTEAQDVPLDDGWFSVSLGAVEPLTPDLLGVDGAWLGMAVGSDPELPGRVPLASVPYALRAHTLAGGTVDAAEIRVDGQPVIGPDRVVHAAGIEVNGAPLVDGDGLRVSWGDLDDVPADLDALAYVSDGCVSGDRLAWSGVAWECAAPATSFSADQIASGTLAVARLPVGTSDGTVAAGDHTHAATAITSGTIAFARLPVGDGADQVAAGAHTHDAAAITSGTLDPAVLPDTFRFGELDVPCDASRVGTIRWRDDAFEGCTSDGWVWLGGKPRVGLGPDDPAASCVDVLEAHPGATSGVFWLSSDDGPFEAWCDMQTEGGGWLDLVRTFHLPSAEPERLLARYFESNGVNGTRITVGLGRQTSTGDRGFYVDNDAYSSAHTQGFHFRPSGPSFTSIRVDWRMQGSDHDNRCNTENWVPLNGPGFDGGHNEYGYPCPEGFTCIAGRPKMYRDAPVAASWSSDSLTPTTLPAWSNSVTNGVSASCARDPEIPTTHPTTFFTTFLVR